MTAAGAAVDVERIADDVFFRDATAVDRDGLIPAEHFEALAAAGLYGPFAPVELGGAGLDPGSLTHAIEVLASGCLATTFVWIQHFGLLGTLLDPGAPRDLRDRFLEPVIRGQVRGGIALAGLLPDPPLLTADPVEGGWMVDGECPWVTGWRYVDLIHVVARHGGDQVVSFVIDASEGRGITAARQPLAAVDASATVSLRFEGVFVPTERVTSVRPHDPLGQSERLRSNGSLALGITRRCCALLGPSPLDDDLAACRGQLDGADTAQMPDARAAASALAVRAAAALTVARGSRAALAGDHADRLTREAAFTLVFGSRPAIKQALRARLLPDSRA